MNAKSVVKIHGKRTSRSHITEEGLALKELRISHGLSMKELGELVGKSDSYISHIENGRLDFPIDEDLDQILAALGGIKQKSFFERARKSRSRTFMETQIINWLRDSTDEEMVTIYDLLWPKS